MRAFYCDHFVLPLPDGHRFPMAKYARLRERVITEGLVAAGDLHEAPAASWEALTLAHTPAYVAAVAAGTLSAEMLRRIGFPWSPAMVERSRRSAGATIAAARAALDDGAAVNLAGGTHHAFADRGEGYCVFNDVAVAARLLQHEGRCTRIAVVDCDVHQGNGTAAIFRNDHTVFTFSMHGEKNYPFRKETSDLDVELPDGTGDAAYLAALSAHLPAVFARQQPELVFYLAGADPFEGDRLGRLRVSMAGLEARDALVFDACRAAGTPVAVAMSGGYAPEVDDIVAIHLHTVRAAAVLARPRRAPA
jgi:acetoin utilization deacetylase AcuC-like enzyme